MLESGTYNKFRTGEQRKESWEPHPVQGHLCGGTGVLRDGLVISAHAVVKNGCISFLGAGGRDFSPLFSTGETMSRHWVQFRLPSTKQIVTTGSELSGATKLEGI